MKLKSFLLKSSSLFNCLALLLVVQGANSACAWIVHQPEFPEEADAQSMHRLNWHPEQQVTMPIQPVHGLCISQNFLKRQIVLKR